MSSKYDINTFKVGYYYLSFDPENFDWNDIEYGWTHAVKYLGGDNMQWIGTFSHSSWGECEYLNATFNYSGQCGKGFAIEVPPDKINETLLKIKLKHPEFRYNVKGV